MSWPSSHIIPTAFLQPMQVENCQHQKNRNIRGVFFSQRWLWRMSSSGMRRCVNPRLTDVSEERIVSISRVENPASGEPAWAGGCKLSQQSEITRLYKRRLNQDVHRATSQKTTFFMKKSHCSVLLYPIILLLKAASRLYSCFNVK
jgi:hypothetical protein